MGNITFTMIKPEAVEQVTLDNFKRIEDGGFRIMALKKVHLSEEKLENSMKFIKIDLFIEN